MSQLEQLSRLLTENKGIVKLSEAVDLGISKSAFYRFAHSLKLEKAAPGIYLSEDAWKDSMFILHLRFEQLVFSHASALLLHDLTDREPFSYEITVKTGYNPSNLKKEGLKVFTVKPDLHEIGLTKIESPFGHLVPCYDMERTICDILRSRSQIEMQTVQGALRAYVRRKDKNLGILMKDAALFRVDKLLMKYLEVLL